MQAKRDHGGGLDAAAVTFGGARCDWLDLSTGINPVPYPLPALSPDCWTALPDTAALDQLLAAARAFWNVPEGVEIVAAPGASALIARMPYLTNLTGGVYIPGPTYNEHAAAVETADAVWLCDDPEDAVMHIYVHPNNPDGRLWDSSHMGGRPLTVIDESFCDVSPEDSLVHLTKNPGTVVLKSFGKFWGLAGLRLGFAIGSAATLAHAAQAKGTHGTPSTPPRATLAEHLGPWAVSGPALEIGAQALTDFDWATKTRTRLTSDAAQLDSLMTTKGAQVVGGTTLFRLYDVSDSLEWQTALAKHRIWTRAFPYNPRWLRLGLPGPDGWARLEKALA